MTTAAPSPLFNRWWYKLPANHCAPTLCALIRPKTLIPVSVPIRLLSIVVPALAGLMIKRLPHPLYLLSTRQHFTATSAPSM